MMTLQELATAYGDADADTVDLVETVLQWRRNVPSLRSGDVPEIWRRLKSLLKKEDDVSLTEMTRQAVLDEGDRLISLKKESEKQIEICRQENDDIEVAVTNIRRSKEQFEMRKQEYEDWKKKETNVQKELNETKRRLNELKQLVLESQKSEWLGDGVKNALQMAWQSLPLDSLDAFLAEQ